MVYDKDDTLNRAKKFISSNDFEELKYACLDLRMCIELICYEKFELYLNEIPIDVFKMWQPRKVLNFLLEIDPYACFDHSLVVGREGKNGHWGEGSLVIDHKAITLKFVKDTYDKLGRYLHIPTTSDQRSGHLEFMKKELRNYLLKEVIPEMERLCESEGSANITERISFECAYCGALWSPSKRSLEKFKIAVCPMDGCRAQYDFSYVEGKPALHVKKRGYRCLTCGEANFIEEHKLNEGLNIVCKKCSSNFLLKKTGWNIERRE
jgi:DNA-directed RNA polymerase subunit RPC12/RpoP